MRLKSLDRPPPGGWTFQFPNLPNWKPNDASRWSMDVLTNQVWNVISANKTYARNYSWPKSLGETKQWVIDFNTKHVEAMGWTEWLEGGGPKPAPFPPTSMSAPASGAVVAADKVSWFQRLGQAWTGIKTLGDWLGDKPVEKEMAEARAKICSDCPKNERGDWMATFTKPASELIRRQMNERLQMKLVTTHDAALGVCGACACPLKLKVHVGINHIVAHMDAATEARLDARCWIRAEK